MVTQVQLEYIVAVDKYRHFVTAAEHCFVTQPTLSMQIKKMEEYLGVTIFDRSKHPVIPTEIGVEIIDQARLSLAEHKKVYEIVASYKGMITGNLTIGVIPSLAPYLIPLFIGSFSREYPDVHLKVIELLTEELIDYLNKGLIDVGILATPLLEKGIKETPLFYEKMMVYINKSHRLASASSIEIDEIATADLWLLSKGHCFRSHVLNLCNYKLNIENTSFEYESGSIESLRNIVDREGGFTIIPELALPADFESENAIIKQFNDYVPVREISLVSTRHFVKKRLLDILRNKIQDAIPKPMLDRERGTIVEWR